MPTPVLPQYSYLATVSRNGNVIVSKQINAKDRRNAVTLALNWFWYTYHGSLGPAHKCLIVDDPYNEVHYGPKFRCNDRMNKLLPIGVCSRLFVESNGEIIIDRREGKKYHQPNSVIRRRRRRDFGRFIAPGLRQLNNGNMYFRITTQSQITRKGRRIRKRKYREILLDTKNPHDALGEIQMRGLHRRSKVGRGTQRRVDRLEVTAHILGVITLSPDKQKQHSKMIKPYEEHRSCKTRVA